jgi:hypothetical protein
MKSHFAIRALIVVNVMVGLFTYAKYGESWDVNSLRHYADASLEMYGGVLSGRGILPEVAAERLALGNYGPAHAMLVRLIERLIEPSQGDQPHAIPHLVYFLTFQAGVAAFYVLCRRWLDERAAFGATLLLCSQPVVWGHGFINPKDIPLMAFFLLAMAAGFQMVDRLQPLPISRRGSFLLGFLWLLPFAVVFFGSRSIHAWIERSVHLGASGQANLVSLVASDLSTTAVEIYIAKYSGLFLGLALLFMLLSTPALLFIARRFWRPGYSTILTVAPAAILLGSAAAIRNLGLYAGILVSGYALWRHRRKAVLPLLLYGVCSAAVLYVLWPHLWLDPIGNLYESVIVMSRYPWSDPVLFNGVQYSASALPASYLPVLLGIQLSEPVGILCVAGLITGWLFRKRYRGLILLASVWFLAPLLALVMFRTPLYDNFRQVLFLLPPIFLLTGIALQCLGSPRLTTFAIALGVLPGLIGISSLHPYEYAYYNSFVGGVSGAFRRFELDYWGTSYQEAAEFVNWVAAPNANVWVEGPAQLITAGAREDLNIFSTHEIERAETYDYIIATTRFNLDQAAFPEAHVIHAIRRGSAILSVVKQP